MDWRIKAVAQNVCSILPGGSRLYWRLQQAFGSLGGTYDPTPMLREAASFARLLTELGRPIASSRVLEIGTGRRLAGMRREQGMVEMRGLEPLTPAMRTRCSPS